MDIVEGTPVAGARVLVTGANRGIGLAFVREALSCGAAKVYAGVRDLSEPTSELRATGAEPVELDVTDPEQVAAAARCCPDVTVLVNNAGLFTANRLVLADDLNAARREMEVNYFGPLSTTRAFAPVIERNGGGSIVNVLSAAAIAPTPIVGGYSPAKGAALYLSSISRAELEPLGISVTALIVGRADTRMAAHVRSGKEDPRAIAATGLRAMERGERVCDTDRVAIEARARLALDPVSYERALGRLPHHRKR